MYFVALNNEKAGPFTLAQLQEMWRAGTVRAETLFWEQGMADWQPLDYAAAARLGLPDLDSLRFAPPASVPLAPAAASFAPAARDPLAPPATSHEPSAYDLPAEHLPAAPVPRPPPTLPPPAPVPPPVMPTQAVAALAAPGTPRPDGPHSLIAPTRLPSGTGADTLFPAAPASYPALANLSNQVPANAYISLGCAVGWPALLFLHGIGWLISLVMMIAAVICGHAARAEIRRSGNRLPGLGIATTGLALGYVGLAFVAVMIVIVLLGIFLVVLGITQAHHN